MDNYDENIICLISEEEEILIIQTNFFNCEIFFYFWLSKLVCIFEFKIS